MKIPLIQYYIMKNAIKCFKYLFVNGYDGFQTKQWKNKIQNQIIVKCINFIKSKIMSSSKKKSIKEEL